MKITKIVIASLILASISVTANATPILVVTPSETETTVGSQVTVDVSITNLLGELVGDYDLLLEFDDAILSYVDILFGTYLDGPLFSFQDVFPSPGSVEAYEISFDLLWNQDGYTNFSFFTLTFDVIGAGTTGLDLSVFAMGDFFGDPLYPEIQNSSLTATAVPEPGTLTLLALGLLGIASTRRRKVRG